MAHVRRVTRPAAEVLASTAALMDSGRVEFTDSPLHFKADLSGRCSADLVVEQAGYGHLRLGTKGEEKWEPARTLSLKVPCRRCDPCRKAKRMEWTHRALREWRASTRTWMVTLTIEPGRRFVYTEAARKRLRDSGGDFDRLSDTDKFAELVRQQQPDVKLAFQRLRKGLAKRGWKQASFRHLLVAERHADGQPHYHALLHEVSPEMPLVKRRIDEAWRLGFVKAKLVQSELEVRYIVKYLGKQDFSGRVRASLHYGEGHEHKLDDQWAAWRMASAPPSVLPEDRVELARALRRDFGIPIGAPVPDLREQPCPAGIHTGVACDCAPTDGAEGESGGDEPTAGRYSGDVFPEQMARERRTRRGWSVPMPRLADLSALECAPVEASAPPAHPSPPPPETAVEEDEEECGSGLDDTGWVDPDTYDPPWEQGRDGPDVPDCVERPKRRGG